MLTLRYADIFRLSAAIRQFSYIRRDPPRLVAGEQLGRRSTPRLVLEINIGKRLPAVVADNKAGGLFLDSPRRREAAGRQVCVIHSQQSKAVGTLTNGFALFP